MSALTHFSLFSGIGGIDLAAEAAGFTTVCQCEWADFPMEVLKKHWPQVPKFKDITTVTKEAFFEKTGRETTTLISGGFPCQPFSSAGKQRGFEDERYLWPEMLRVIRAIRPNCVVGENVPGILKIAARQVVEDLEREGYNAIVFNFEAAAVGAWHRRSRFFFVGIAEGRLTSDAESERSEGQPSARTAEQDEKPWEMQPDAVYSIGTAIHNTVCGRFDRDARRRESPELADGRQWAAEPGVGRVANGLPCRVERIRALGNAVVPQQEYPIFRALAEELNRRIDNEH